MNKNSEMIMAILAITLGAIGLAICFFAIQQEYLEYKAEGVCVERHISRGIERSDIVTRDGICYVRGE